MLRWYLARSAYTSPLTGDTHLGNSHSLDGVVSNGPGQYTFSKWALICIHGVNMFTHSIPRLARLIHHEDLSECATLVVHAMTYYSPQIVYYQPGVDTGNSLYSEYVDGTCHYSVKKLSHQHSHSGTTGHSQYVHHLHTTLNSPSTGE